MLKEHLNLCHTNILVKEKLIPQRTKPEDLKFLYAMHILYVFLMTTTTTDLSLKKTQTNQGFHSVFLPTLSVSKVRKF